MLVDALDQHHLQLLLRLVLGALLLLAGVTKLADRSAFRAAVSEYQLLPSRLEGPFATALPLLETTLGALLLLGLGTAFAAALAAPLFLTFGIAIGLNMVRGRVFDCHCFGALQSEGIGWPAFVRSLALGAAAIVVAVGASGFGALETALGGSSAGLPPTVEIIPVMFMAALILDVLILLPQTVAFRSILAGVRTRGQTHGSHHNERAAA